MRNSTVENCIMLWSLIKHVYLAGIFRTGGMDVSMRYSFDKILFYISIFIVFSTLVFCYGYLVHRIQIFPYRFIDNTVLAAEAVWEVQTQKDKAIHGVDFLDSELLNPTTKTLSDKAGKENILILSNEFAHRSLNETGCFAWIMDRSGKVLHAWRNNQNIWEPLENRDALGDNWRAYPVGAYLYPNGDLLVSYQGGNVFPNSLGLAKFDSNSKLLWKNNGYFHHWFDVDDQGRIYIPTHKIIESPLKIPDYNKYITCEKTKFTYDTLSILNPDGTLIEEIDLFRAMVDSDLVGAFNNNGQHFVEIKSCDPMHLNDVRIIRKGDHEKSRRINSGDLLMSFRSLNAVGIFDLNNKLFKWFHIGAFHSQHSPRYVGENRIFAFDNLGGRKSLGTSRIVSINLQNGNWETVFPKEGVKIPSRHFFSETAGHLEIHSSEKRMIVSWTHRGLVWEIDVESGEVIWEYVNTHPLDDNKFGRISIYSSLYAEHAEFELNYGKFH